MRLRHIEVENFLNHHRESLDFPDHGFFFLDGDSGNGKSGLIIDAPGFALFGAKATRAERGKIELLRHHDYPEEPMRVRVDFEFDGGEILVIERGIDEKGAGYAEVRSPNSTEPLALGPSPVERYIRKRLGGMSWRQFYSAFVARQDEIKKLTSLTGSERRDLVHALLGVRELELAQKEAVDRRKRLKLELDRLIEQVGERTRQGMDEQVAQMQVALTEAEQALQQADQALAAKRQELEALLARIAPLLAAQKAKEEITRLENQMQLRATKLEGLREKQARHAQAEALIAEAADLDQQLAEVADAIEQTTQEGLRAKRHADLLEEHAAAAERLTEAKLRAGAPVRIEVGQGAVTMSAGDGDDEEGAPVRSPSSERLHARLEEIARERKRLGAEKAKRSKDLELLNESGECFTCHRPLAEHEEREHVFQSLQEGLAELEQAEKDLSREEEEINTLLPQVTQLEIERGSADRELAKAEEAVRLSEGEIARLLAQGEIGDREALRAQLKEQRQRQDTLKARQAEINTLKRDLDPSLAGQIAAAEREQAQDDEKLAAARAQAGVEVDPSAIAEAQQAEQETREAIAAQEGRLPLLQDSRKRAEADLKHAQAEREAFALLLSEREEKAVLLRRLEDLVGYYDQFARYLAGEIRPALEEMGSEMLAQLSNGRHIAMRIDDNYDIEIQREEGTWLRASSISGGEGVRANLCLRMALTRLVSRRTGVPVQFLVLDEPLPSQDQGHVENILTLLKSLEAFYPQLFLISHVPVQGADYRLTFPTPDGTNRVTLEYA